jgi:hypothetical protein
MKFFNREHHPEPEQPHETDGSDMSEHMVPPPEQTIAVPGIRRIVHDMVERYSERAPRLAESDLAPPPTTDSELLRNLPPEPIPIDLRLYGNTETPTPKESQQATALLADAVQQAWQAYPGLATYSQQHHETGSAVRGEYLHMDVPSPPDQFVAVAIDERGAVSVNVDDKAPGGIYAPLPLAGDERSFDVPVQVTDELTVRQTTYYYTLPHEGCAHTVARRYDVSVDAAAAGTEVKPVRVNEREAAFIADLIHRARPMVIDDAMLSALHVLEMDEQSPDELLEQMAQSNRLIEPFDATIAHYTQRCRQQEQQHNVVPTDATRTIRQLRQEIDATSTATLTVQTAQRTADTAPLVQCRFELVDATGKAPGQEPMRFIRIQSFWTAAQASGEQHLYSKLEQHVYNDHESNRSYAIEPHTMLLTANSFSQLKQFLYDPHIATHYVEL